MRDWVTNVDDTHYIIGSVAGPHPYPQIVRDFNSIVGVELKSQSREVFGRYPDKLLLASAGDQTQWVFFILFSRIIQLI